MDYSHGTFAEIFYRQSIQAFNSGMLNCKAACQFSTLPRGDHAPSEAFWACADVP